jgi:PST family polysaccharide transporter
MSLGKIAFGTAAMSSVNVLRLLAQFFALPLLARRLSPADYGIVGLAMPFLTFAMMIADAGIAMSLVRSSPSRRGVWSTCFWLSTFLGLALAIAMAGSAPLAAIIFDEPRLGPIVMALGLVILAQGILAVPMTMLQQENRFHVIAAIETTAVVVSIGTAVVIALDGGGAWALVGQQLAFFAVRLVATLLVSPFRPLLVWDLLSVREHLTFGRDILTVNIVSFFSRSMDNLIIGKVLGVAAVGVFSMTFQFFRLPLMLVTGPLQYVIYAQLARLGGDRFAIRRMFLFLTRGLAILAFPVIGMVAAAHHPVFKLLLSEKWQQSGELFLILAPASAAQQLTALSGTVTLALGRTDIQLRTTLEFGIIWIGALLTSVWFGLEWAAIAHSCAVLIYTPRLLMRALPLIDCPALLYAETVIIPVIVTLACMVVFFELNRVMLLGELAQLCLGATLVILGIIASAVAQHRVLRQGIITVT